MKIQSNYCPYTGRKQYDISKPNKATQQTKKQGHPTPLEV